MKGFKKGDDPRRNITGRPRGKGNRTTEELRSAVQLFIEKNWNRIQADFDAVKPSERLSFLNSLLKYVLPDPITPDRLSDAQLTQLLEYLKIKYDE